MEDSEIKAALKEMRNVSLTSVALRNIFKIKTIYSIYSIICRILQ
jgi:hypothetical protein